MRAADAALDPWRRYTAPRFYGLERVPDERPLLFVGNHTLYGVLDIPLLFFALYRRHGIMLRGLGDHLHFQVPMWRSLLGYFGAVDGTPAGFASLMAQRQAVLVFPGGGREVAKRKGERHQLVWKQRSGFARLALAHGCTIVPFAAVGVEDALDVVWDADDLMRTPLGHVVRRLGIRPDVIWPVARGIGPTPLPRRVPYLFEIGHPLRPAEVIDPSAPHLTQVQQVREATRAAVEAGIARLRALRQADAAPAPPP
jgi:1-acyl-sn-glycerol-3-phosphate acyltransferase